MAQKPRLPKGTRDFGPDEMRRRYYLLDTLREVFRRYGYQPIETPAMESLSTLTGKYGEEGDRLLFKVLNNGDFLAKADSKALDKRDSSGIVSSISKRGLRYDLTVPFARHVVMEQHRLSFPFKRYQMQPVWRADRPQKGRYQEFYQCDADVVGSDSLMYEAELIQLYDEAFRRLNLPVVIRVNHRKILQGIAEAAGVTDRFIDMTVAIDKVDKIGADGVRDELLKRDFPANAVKQIMDTLAAGDLESIRPILMSTLAGKAGLSELDEINAYLQDYDGTNDWQVDITLARGLGYYTGTIFEVQAVDADMGSIGGGGRYADLTSVFGLKHMSGVGISFGLERIYDVLLEKKLFPERIKQDLQLLLIAFDAATHRYAFQVLGALRAAGLLADLYPEPVKLGKQMKYANDRSVPYTVLIGEQEMATGRLSLKNMETGEQQPLVLEDIIRQLRA